MPDALRFPVRIPINGGGDDVVEGNVEDDEDDGQQNAQGTISTDPSTFLSSLIPFRVFAEGLNRGHAHDLPRLRVARNP